MGQMPHHSMVLKDALGLQQDCDVVCGENPESSELFTCFEFFKSQKKPVLW